MSIIPEGSGPSGEDVARKKIDRGKAAYWVIGLLVAACGGYLLFTRVVIPALQRADKSWTGSGTYLHERHKKIRR
ncbi:MAG: hypothetical protein ACE5F1_20390 [Planctomycetota bacterium]